MQVLSETNKNLNHVITMTVNYETINETIKQELINLSKTIKVNGFRKGKVPIDIISQRYKKYVTQDILNNLMKDNFVKMLIERKINIIGSPIYVPDKYIEKQDFKYTVKFTIYPTMDFKKLENIKIEKPLVTITENDIDTTIETIQQKNIQWIQQNRQVQNKDRVTIDLVSYNDKGIKIKDGVVSDFILPLGMGYMVPDFENNIIGHEVGDEFYIHSTFPIDYHSTFLRGKTVSFNIKIKKIETPIIPEINETLIRSLGIKDTSISNFRNEIRKNIELEIESAVYKDIKNQILEEIINLNIINVPMMLIKDAVNLINRKSLKKDDSTKQQNDQIPKKSLQYQAKKRVTMELLLNNMIKKYNLNIEAEKFDIKEMLKKTACYKNSKEIINFYKKNDNILNNIKNMVIEKQVIDIILSKAKVIDKPITLNTLINKLNNNFN
ncbi:trigger factor [Candidatus Pantoea edessiphila]|uniref:Trigger factor n=1 Tax=Candidatus Pantoea edessiphila TaxID=2044610 RepID=A0A2P5SVI7_9GAMM|nr:trigger factor [Candidatus Pantoea edessiphila]PPI86330.1 trigger factor [Candidatus Pantoea edessiphila]